MPCGGGPGPPRASSRRGHYRWCAGVGAVSTARARGLAARATGAEGRLVCRRGDPGPAELTVAAGRPAVRGGGGGLEGGGDVRALVVELGALLAALPLDETRRGGERQERGPVPPLVEQGRLEVPVGLVARVVADTEALVQREDDELLLRRLQ